MGIYLLRHGETEWSRAGRKQGRADSPLTPLGITQVYGCARRLARETSGCSSLHLVTSPLGRARASAEIVRTVLGLSEDSFSVSDFLAEHDYGAWEGLTKAEIEERFPGQLAFRRRQHWNFVVPGGESYALLARRLHEWLARQDPGRTVIAVAHDMVSRVLRGLYLGLPSPEVLRLDHPHTRIYVLEHGNVRAIEVAPVSNREHR
jgi:probable phosphoglycerate mutase